METDRSQPVQLVEEQEVPPIEDFGEVDVNAPVEEEIPDTSAPETEAPSIESDGGDIPPADIPPPAPPAEARASRAAGDANAAEIAELYKMREANAQKEWEQQTLRQAQAIERRANQQGVDPQASRQMARQYVGHQKELKDQESKAVNLVGFVEGRNRAVMHFANKYKLLPKQVMEDLQSLSQFRSPQEMEHEARRIQQHRNQAAEIARLKQGRVAPQTFDNSQGSAEVSTNEDRLLDAYLAGDRSDAAVRAARRISLGS